MSPVQSHFASRWFCATVLGAALFATACGRSGSSSDDGPPDAGDDDAPREGFESSRPGGPAGSRGDDDATADGDPAGEDSEPEPPTAGDDDETLSPERAIQEADIIEIEGDRLYALSYYGGLSVVDVSEPDDLQLLGRHKLLASPFEMYVEEGNAFVLYNGFGEYEFDEETEQWDWYQTSYLIAIDASEPDAMVERGRFPVAGTISDSRIIGDILYVVAFEDGYCWECGDEPRTNLISLDVSRPNAIEQVDALSFEESENTYGWRKSLSSTDERLFIAGPAWGASEQPEGSVIQVVDVSDTAGRMVLGDSVELGGQVESRWQMDEYEGVLRVISQPFTWRTDQVPVVETFAIESSESIVPLGSLEMVLPRPERLQSVRFDGPRAYAITFEQTDPLFTIDLSNPAEPVQRGELEIPGWVYYMHPHGDRLLGLGFDQGNEDGALHVSLFDVSDLDTPTMIERVNFGGEWASLAEDQDRIHKSFRVLDEENLIVIPFSGWTYDESTADCQSSSYQSGVQLVDWDDASDELALRGVALARGSARRGFLHRDALFTMSDDRVETFDVSDRDEPRRLDGVALSRRVDRVTGIGDTLVSVGYDWWTNVAELTTSSLSQPNSWLDPAELELPQLDRDECYGYSYLADLRASEEAVYLSYYQYSYDRENRASEETTRVVTVDISDPSAPRVVGDAPLDFTPNGGYGYVPGLVWSGEALVSAGSTLVFSHHEYEYDDSGYRDSEQHFAHVVDLSDPENPESTEVELPVGLGSTGLLLDGDVVATSHFEASPSDPEIVRFFLDRVDVGDPRAPERLDPVNVPGSLLAYDAASERAIVVDYRALDSETTADDCYRNEGGWFEVPSGDGAYNENTIGTCHAIRQILRLVAIEAGEASVIESYPLANDEHIGVAVLGDDRLFVSLGAGYYGYAEDDVAVGRGGTVSFDAGTADLLVISGIRSGEFVASRLSLQTGDNYGGLNQLVAHGQRAVVATGWRGSLSVIDASQADSPRVVRDVAVSGYVQDLQIVGNTAVAALGYDGVATIAIE
jgi:hypothetical protein